MKNVLLRTVLIAVLSLGTIAGTSLFAQHNDAVTDSLSIDDMDPVLYDEDAYDDEEESASNGVTIAIVIVAGIAVVAGGLIMAKKKKK